MKGFIRIFDGVFQKAAPSVLLRGVWEYHRFSLAERSMNECAMPT